ncbi:hypothetical protein [Evansella halocellulosilytica]|uniref:hypothetical protein n=1 Tax=Evansella halocellulosilytica TaxID=2011013 RepID=UPI000BB863AA|nr:hypothetical protein [Evansella halocellulosilytica]
MVFCDHCETEVDEVLMEADYGADPFWCQECLGNLDLEDFPLDEHIKVMLLEWTLEYGSFIDFVKNKYVENGRDMEKAFNEKGQLLKNMVEYELGNEMSITFKPSEYYKVLEDS